MTWPAHAVDHFTPATRTFVGQIPDGPRVVVHVFTEGAQIVGMEAALREDTGHGWGVPAQMEEEK